MILPKSFTPNEFTNVSLPSGRKVKLPVCHPVFERYSEDGLGAANLFSFGNKPMVDFGGEGVFPELAILRTFMDAGWNGAWVSTYGGLHFLQAMPTNWKLSSQTASIPADKEALLHDIWKAGKTRGCFDVFAWKGNTILFCESKQRGEKLTRAQVKFIEGALASGLKPEHFLICEWGYRTDV